MRNVLNLIYIIVSLCVIAPLNSKGAITPNSISTPIEYRHITLNKRYRLSEQLTKDNTIYLVQNGFDLQGRTIIIPDNCELRFDGGYFTNGRVVFNNTLLSGNIIQLLCDCTGSLNNEYIDPVWFGADPKGKEDSTKSLQMAIDIASNSRCMNFKMPSGTFLISAPLIVYRHKNIEFHGSHNSVIKANKPMDYMITASDRNRRNYISSRFHTFVLDGNRKSPIFNEGKWTFTSTTSLAKGGFSFPCGFIYTQIYDIMFNNIDGWAFDVIDTYNIDYHNLSFYYCENGLALHNANGITVSNCEFTTIRGFGALIGWGHKISFRDNVMEKIGKAAIVIGNGAGPVSINSNYFEECSIGGIDLSLADSEIVKNLHFVIGVVGVNIESYKDKKNIYPIGKTNLSQVLVSGNDFQEKATDRTCLILGSALEFSTISNNRAYEDVVVLGTLIDSRTSLVKGTRVEDNTNYKKKKKLPGVGSLYVRKGANKSTIIDVKE